MESVVRQRGPVREPLTKQTLTRCGPHFMLNSNRPGAGGPGLSGRGQASLYSPRSFHCERNLSSSLFAPRSERTTCMFPGRSGETSQDPSMALEPNHQPLRQIRPPPRTEATEDHGHQETQAVRWTGQQRESARRSASCRVTLGKSYALCSGPGSRHCSTVTCDDFYGPVSSTPLRSWVSS